MKRTWIWGTCAMVITGGAIALAQQDGAGPAPPPPPVAAAGSTAPSQELPPTGPPAAVPPVAGVQAGSAPPPVAPPFGVARASNDPFAGQGAAAASTPSADPFGRGPMKAAAQGGAARGDDWDAVPSQNRSNNSRFGGRGFSGQSGFSGGFGSLGGNFPHGQNIVSKAASAETKAFHEAEQKLAQAYGHLRSLNSDNPNYAKADEELKAAVKAAFEARQAMQKAEVKRLKDKLAEIEAQVTRRESAKDVLIEDRYFDLKNNSGGNAPAGVFSPVNGAFPSANSFPVQSGPTLFETAPGGGGAFFDAPVPSTTPSATPSPSPEAPPANTTPAPETTRNTPQPR